MATTTTTTVDDTRAPGSLAREWLVNRNNLARRPSLLRAVLLGLALVVAGCGGGASSEDGDDAGGDGGDGGGGDGGGGDGDGGDGGDGGDFEISGSLTGLPSGTVIVRNRNDPAQQRDVNADESFSFLVPGDSGYSLNIFRNAEEHFCRIENGSASSVSGNVTNVVIICESAGIPAVAAACSGAADSDGDGLADCVEFNVHGTHPWQSDTDGDGRNDFEEVGLFNPANPFQSNPRIADMPSIAVDLRSLPTISLDFSESSGGTRVVSTGHDVSQVSGITNERGGDSTRQVETGHSQGGSATVTVGAEVSYSPTDGFGGKVSYEQSLTTSYESSRSDSRGSSVNWNTAENRENRRAYNETLTLEETTGITYSGGELKIAADVRNNSAISYDIENLVLSAVVYDPRNPFAVTPIGNLTGDNGGFPRATLVQNARLENLVFSTTLSLGEARNLLRDSRNLLIKPVTFRLIDSGDGSALLREDDVAPVTASVVIDYGASGTGREQKHRVAIDRGDGNEYVTAMEVLQSILGLQVTQAAGQWIYGDDVSARPTPSGLLELNGTAMNSNPAVNGYWILAHNYNNPPSPGAPTTDFYNLLLEGYDLNDIRLRARDNLALVYVRDSDRDGLSDRSEREYQTEPDDADSDDDGLGDGVEVFGWDVDLASVLPDCSGPDLVRVVSNPLERDTDDDGELDADEKAACQNPSANFTVTVTVDPPIAATRGRVLDRVGLLAKVQSPQAPAPGQFVYNWTLVNGPDVWVEDSTGTPTQTRDLAGSAPTFTTPEEVSSLVFRVDVTDTDSGLTETSDGVRVQVVLDPTRSVFVGNAGPGTADGSMANPYTEITSAIGERPNADLYIMNRGTPYQLTNTLRIRNGISLFGGYDTNWIRDAGGNFTPIARSTVLDMEPVVEIIEVSGKSWFSGFSVNSTNTGSNPANSIVAMRVMPDEQREGTLNITHNRLTSGNVAAGRSTNAGSSYALMIGNVSTLRLTDNTLTAGAGAPGAHGSTGGRGVDGTTPTCCTGGSGTDGADGGNGGGGGGVPNRSGSSGQPGATNAGGASGGTGGPGNSGTGGAGAPGAPGRTGVGGRPGWPASVAAGRYLPANAQSGGNGQDAGGGGGGGGGEGAIVVFGGTGGAGGEGGTGGRGATRGSGGGASIALWLERGIENATIERNVISSGRGGDGGDNSYPQRLDVFGLASNGTSIVFVGSNGGGGSTGNPAPCGSIFCVDGDTGGTGGPGGDGGIGGFSGSGAGGPSLGIFVGPGLTPTLSGNRITSAQAGNGGRIVEPFPNVSPGFGAGSYCIDTSFFPRICMNVDMVIGGDGGDSYAIYDADPLTTRPNLTGINDRLFGAPGDSPPPMFGGTAGAAGQQNFVP